VDDVLDALVGVARPIILSEFRKDSCIASTRVAIDALAYFGVKAEPLPVIATIFNAEAAAILNGGGTLEELAAAQQEKELDEPGGPWSLAIGTGHSRNNDRPIWEGHLVAAIPDEQVFIDLSIDQAARPTKGMNFEPYWTRVEDDHWWNGEETLHQLTHENGMVLIMDRRAADPEGFKASNNWKATGHMKSVMRDVTGKVIRAMKTELR
jgi:hypothetical protein